MLSGCRRGCRRSIGLFGALDVGSSAPQQFWGAPPGTGLRVDLLWNGQVSLHLSQPPVTAESCFLPYPSGCSVSSHIPGFLKTCCSSSCTRQGGNNNMEALLKYLPRPAYGTYCCPGVGFEVGGLDSVPLILMTSRQIHHLQWSKLVVFLLLPLELHQA